MFSGCTASFEAEYRIPIPDLLPTRFWHYRRPDREPNQISRDNILVKSLQKVILSQHQQSHRKNAKQPLGHSPNCALGAPVHAGRAVSGLVR